MHVPYKELMDKLGVGYPLGAYETCPWSAYDGEKGITCSAEVRMDTSGEEIEAEIQMMYDEPLTGQLPMEQICVIRAKNHSGDDWGVISLKIRGEAFGEDIYNWEEKSCNFFHAVVKDLIQDEIPDVDEHIDREFHSYERMGDQSQGGGSKSPRVNARQIMSMNQKGSM